MILHPLPGPKASFIFLLFDRRSREIFSKELQKV